MQFALMPILEYFLLVSSTVPQVAPPFTVAADPFKKKKSGIYNYRLPPNSISHHYKCGLNLDGACNTPSHSLHYSWNPQNQVQ